MVEEVSFFAPLKEFINVDAQKHYDAFFQYGKSSAYWVDEEKGYMVLYPDRDIETGEFLSSPIQVNFEDELYERLLKICNKLMSDLESKVMSIIDPAHRQSYLDQVVVVTNYYKDFLQNSKWGKYSSLVELLAVASSSLEGKFSMNTKQENASTKLLAVIGTLILKNLKAKGDKTKQTAFLQLLTGKQTEAISKNTTFYKTIGGQLTKPQLYEARPIFVEAGIDLIVKYIDKEIAEIDRKSGI